MDTTEFLTRVLPSTGYYVATVINPDRRAQKSYETIDALSNAVVRIDIAGSNVYYAMSSFHEAGNRKQINVAKTKALFIDIDCGEDKPFADQREGAKALKTFLKDSGLPPPMIVNSGRGLHVYWPLTEELEPVDWQPLANALKECAVHHGFEIDPAVTADSARVLRPLGTHNPKNGAEVTLIKDAPDNDPATLRQLLSAYIKQVPAKRGFAAQAKAAPSSLTAALSSGQEYEPATAGNVYDGCAQVSWAVNNQSDVEEPFWYALLGIAAFCDDPETTAIAWSDQHPAFDYSKTVLKVEQWRAKATGPTTCKKLKELRSAGCNKCPFAGKITSPCQIGRKFAEADEPAADVLDTVAHEVPLPAGYKRTKAGGIAQTIDDTDIEVVPFDLYPVGYGRDEALGYEVVRFHWKRPHRGWQELKFRQAYLADGNREFPTAIADQGIVLPFKGATERFQYMLRSYMDELRKMRTTTNLYTTLGWKEDNTLFVIGDKQVRKDEQGQVVTEDVVLSSSVQRLSAGMHSTKGDFEKWKTVTKLMELAGLKAHIFAMGVSMSAPLYQFTGLKGAVLSLYGPTGSGKSLAQLAMQSIWGDPVELHFQSKYTQNTLFTRLSFYSNLPMTIDETTMMPDKEVGDFIYGVTQGRDKARLNARIEERDPKTWAAPVTLSTNRPMGGKLLSAAFETDAQMARLLELSLDASDIFTSNTDVGRKFYNIVTRNHGHLGMMILEWLVGLGEAGIRKAIADHMVAFEKKYKVRFTGEERYWEVMIVLADLMNKTAVEKGWVSYQYVEATEFALVQAGMTRRSISAAKLDEFDLLGEYLNESRAATVTVTHIDNNPTPLYDPMKLPRGEVRVRFDLYRKTAAADNDRGVLLIDKSHFRRWMASRGGDWKRFTDTLEAESIDATPSSKKAMLGRNLPELRLPQTYVVGINIAHDKLRDLLNNEDSGYESLTLGQLRPVTRPQVH
jgi:hypothetical protein